MEKPAKPKSYLVLLFLSTIFALLIVLGGMFALSNSVNKLTDNLVASFQKHEIEVAESIARSLESEVISIQEKLTIISAHPEIKLASHNCNGELDAAFEITDSKLGNLGRVDKEGFFVCSRNRALVGVKAETLGSYIRDIFQDQNHNPVMSRAIKPAGATSYLSAIHIPVKGENNEFNGTLGGAIYFEQLNDKYFKDVKLTENSYVVLLDDNGDILHHRHSDLIGKNVRSTEFSKYTDPVLYEQIIQSAKSNRLGTKGYVFDGEQKLGAFALVDIFPNRNWVVLITTPQSEIQARLIPLEVSSLFKGYVIINSLIIVIAFSLFTFFVIRNAKKLEEVNIKLKSVDKLKDEFLSLASHQLKTPASGVKAFLSMLLDGDAGKLTKTQAEFAQQAYDANEREIRIVEDLLNVSRIEGGRLVINKQRIDVNKLLKEVADEQRKIIEDQKLAFEVSLYKEPINTNADPDKLKMVYGNLIDNARKYTNEGGSIKVQISKSPEGVIVEVSDNGIGISQENMAKLFQKFERIDSKKSREVGGTGLGLYLVKKIVDLHGGEISVESELGKGTKFVVRLPLT